MKHLKPNPAIPFIDEETRRILAAAQRPTTAHRSVFGTDLTCRFHSLGIAPDPFPWASRKSNGNPKPSHHTKDDDLYPRVTVQSPQELRCLRQEREDE